MHSSNMDGGTSLTLPLLAFVFFAFSLFDSTKIGVRGYNETLLADISNLLNSILDKYDKKIRPRFNDTGMPVKVTVDISVRSMGPISEKDMEFSMNCYFRQHWYDDRLRFEPKHNLHTLMLNAKFLKDIWRPDTYVRNGRKSYHHLLTMPNTMVRIKPNGQVYVSQRITIKTRCHMFLKKFPMDSQACSVELGSLGYATDDLVFVWKETPQVDKDVELSQYKIVDTIQAFENVSSYHSEDHQVSTLIVYFQLKRQQGYYILQLYTPCTLIVVMSWVSFWFNKEASPARVALGVMTVLTMSTMGLSGRTDLPRVSYSTALDLYIVACFGFVFFALVEYAVINFAHFIHIKKALKRMQAMSLTLTPTMEVAESSIPNNGNTSTTFDTSASRNNNCGLTMRENGRILRAKKSIRQSCAQKLASACCCCCPTQRRRQPSEYEFTMTIQQQSSSSKKQQQKNTIDENNLNHGVDWIDDVSKVVFPASYIMFNVLYWLAFLYWIPDEINEIPAIKDKAAKLLAASLSPATLSFETIDELVLNATDMTDTTTLAYQ